MTWSLTLAGLPRAGATNNPTITKKRYKKKDLSKIWVSTGKPFEDFNGKK